MASLSFFKVFQVRHVHIRTFEVDLISNRVCRGLNVYERYILVIYLKQIFYKKVVITNNFIYI